MTSQEKTMFHLLLPLGKWELSCIGNHDHQPCLQYIILYSELRDLFCAPQGCEKFVNLCWMLGWIASEFEIQKQMETRQGKQLEWKEASPLQFHSLEQASELIPRIQLDGQQACMPVQSESRATNNLKFVYEMILISLI